MVKQNFKYRDIISNRIAESCLQKNSVLNRVIVSFELQEATRVIKAFLEDIKKTDIHKGAYGRIKGLIDEYKENESEPVRDAILEEIAQAKAIIHAVKEYKKEKQGEPKEKEVITGGHVKYDIDENSIKANIDKLSNYTLGFSDELQFRGNDISYTYIKDKREIPVGDPRKVSEMYRKYLGLKIRYFEAIQEAIMKVFEDIERKVDEKLGEAEGQFIFDINKDALKRNVGVLITHIFKLKPMKVSINPPVSFSKKGEKKVYGINILEEIKNTVGEEEYKRIADMSEGRIWNIIEKAIGYLKDRFTKARG